MAIKVLVNHLVHRHTMKEEVLPKFKLRSSDCKVQKSICYLEKQQTLMLLSYFRPTPFVLAFLKSQGLLRSSAYKNAANYL